MNFGDYFEHCVLDGVSFGIYSSSEIKKLSVLKVTTPLTFDSLGHPIPGGIYDRTLGPVMSTDKCSTCGNLMNLCLGHIGYIELPLPVIHPLFHNQVLQVLKLSCRSCSNIFLPRNVKHLLLSQLKLLDLGLIVQAYEAESTICSALSSFSHSKDLALADELLVKEQLDSYVEKAISESMLDKVGVVSENRSIEQLRNMFTSSALRSIPSSKKCSYCKTPLISIKKMGGELVMSLNRIEVPQKESEPKKSTVRVRKIGESVLMPQKIRDFLRQVWDKDKEFLKGMFPVLTNTELTHATDLFFIDTVTVTPPWTRPIQIKDNHITEPAYTSTYRSIIQDCIILRHLAEIVQNGNAQKVSKEVQDVLLHIKGNDDLEKLHQVWQELQSNVDHLLDREINKKTNNMMAIGVKQILEKKEGLFRMHMMGKRVNYAARTVITPDPNIDVDEIGVPKAFALKLTYPVPVTPWNAEELRKMIINGPLVHPGACMLQNEDGSINKLKPHDLKQRMCVAKRLLTPGDKENSTGQKVVYRHLCNGDMLLLNRQPTLHRPSMMAHRARILSTEKTFRMHYANCKSYNADFDGDEMNAHFPQNEIPRSEAYNLASVSNHYLVPKDGTPLSGLIQDHVISGVKLTVRGKFFKRSDYQHLVFQGLSQKNGYIKLLPPAIWKPQPLWSGKQVISTILINITHAGKKSINLNSKAKISFKDWEKRKPRPWRGGGSYFKSPTEMSEAEVVIRGGELLCGVLDKNHYGATTYGLVHCINELFGGPSALLLLSCFSKVFGAFLQTEGFSLGVKDIIVRKVADKKRSKVIAKIREAGHGIALEALGLEEADEETLKKQLETAYLADPLKWQTHLDRFYKESLDNFTNEINQICIPGGLLSRFPDNNLQLMIKSGAKGSAVNAMQISCLLGQIELEGKRPPIMKSGKSLPSFAAFDPSPRAGGFVECRFMTGLKPQEFFFHCMAGREGLIDTAVKTSRSGYLQRCLVKHLEGLTVKYDQTVRDSDGSIVQFYYGEDGMDVSKSKFMNEKLFPFLVDNKKVVMNKNILSQVCNSEVMDTIREEKGQIHEWKEKYSGQESIRISPFLCMNIGKELCLTDREMELNPKTGRPAGIQKWIDRLMCYGINERKRAMHGFRCPDPISSKYRIGCVYGSVSELMDNTISAYIEKLAESGTYSSRNIKDIEKMIYLKSMMSTAPPGEPVGLLAAQSVGEPSTQMTLNTFHFAGRGEMNVTLGIPRLREILMVASKNIKTPSMELPFLKDISGINKQSEKLIRKFARVTLADVLHKIHVKEWFETKPPRSTCYEIRMEFLPRSHYKRKFSVKPSTILKAVEKRYLSLLLISLVKASSAKAIPLFFDKKTRGLLTGKAAGDDEDENILESVEEAPPAPNINDNDSSEDDADVDEESAQKSGRSKGAAEYDEPEEEVEKELVEEMKDDEEDLEESIAEEQIVTEEAAEEDFDENDVIDETAAARRNAVVSKSTIIRNYVFDVKKELWCELSLNLPISYKRIDIYSIIKDTAAKCIVQEVPGIRKAITYTDPSDPENICLKTDGINLMEIFGYDRILNINKLYSNDIHGMASTYGIEAACRVIVKEITNVFKAYGIVVDPRHLLLIADYMTRDGTFRPMSRKGMEDSISSFQKMTFESSINFLRSATLNGRVDLLKSPSSCLSFGIPVPVGTGMFDLRYRFPTVELSESE